MVAELFVIEIQHWLTVRRAADTTGWQKWRPSAPQTNLWLIKVWFSASTFVVKVAAFAKRQNVMPDYKKE